MKTKIFKICILFLLISFKTVLAGTTSENIEKPESPEIVSADELCEIKDSNDEGFLFLFS